MMKKINKQKNSKKSNKGITLIALVVTIIVLLLLAGISIQMLTGDNGILNRATQAKEETVAGEVQEERDLWNLAKTMHQVSGSISLPSRGSFRLSLTVLVHYRSSGSV